MNTQTVRMLVFVIFVVLLSSFGQDKGQHTKTNPFTAFLACSDIETTMLPKRVFDSLIAQPLCAKDTLMNTFQLNSFDITYAERGLYQDSAGLPIIFTDYSHATCTGSAVPSDWVTLFKERSYKGDTVYIDNIKVRGANQKLYPCNGIKVVIR